MTGLEACNVGQWKNFLAIFSGKIFTFCVAEAILLVQNGKVRSVLDSTDHEEFKTPINFPIRANNDFTTVCQS